jgi:hypothetical protein
MQSNNHHAIFVCVGVIYSVEYDVCDVTLSVYPHRLRLIKNIVLNEFARTTVCLNV